MVTLRAKLFTLFGALLVGLGSFAFAFFVVGPTPARHSDVVAPGATDASSAKLSRASDPRLVASARLITRYLLPDGREGTPDITTIPGSWQGLSQADLEAAFPDLGVVEFSPGRVVVTERCRVTSDQGFVGLADGRVTIYEGQPGHCQVVLQTTTLDTSALPAFEVQDLNRGIPFATRREMVQILDGLRPGV